MDRFRSYLWVVVPCTVGFLAAFVVTEGARMLYSVASGEHSPTLSYVANAEPASSLDSVATPLGTQGGIRIADAQNITPEPEKGYIVNKRISLPHVTASSYLVADLDTGETIISRNPKVVRPIASVSKLMTALVSIDAIDQSQDTTISLTAANYSTTDDGSTLKIGEQIQIKTLLYPLLLESSNEASEALAEHIGRSSFIRQMNEKANLLGLSQTYFEDPSGLSPRNTSTVGDLFSLVQYLYTNKQPVLDITKRQQFATNDHAWINKSHFKNDEGYLGGKNGFTDEARYTLVTLMTLPISTEGAPAEKHLAFILLHGSNKEEDARALISHVQKAVSYRK